MASRAKPSALTPVPLMKVRERVEP